MQQVDNIQHMYTLRSMRMGLTTCLFKHRKQVNQFDNQLHINTLQHTERLDMKTLRNSLGAHKQQQHIVKIATTHRKINNTKGRLCLQRTLMTTGIASEIVVK